MARVFVLGATGEVGSRLAKQLVDRSDTVIGLHRRPDQARILQSQGIEPVTGV